MKVAYVLRKALRKRGDIGDVVKVAKGYGRYLESQGIAERATQALLESVEVQRAAWRQEAQKFEEQAKRLVEQISGISLTIKRKTAQNDRLYEAIRPEHIVSAFEKLGVSLEKKNIQMHNPIKMLGQHKILVHAYGQYEAEIDVQVVSDVEIGL
jgi:large subunit ribosomal protein L9